MTPRFLLDTNIVSEAVKPRPAAALLEWLGAQPDEALHISALTLAEIRRGILGAPPGRLPTWPLCLFAP